MDGRQPGRTGVMMVAVLAATIVLGVASCSSSDAGGDTTVPVTAPAVTAPMVPQPVATVETVPVVEETTADGTAPAATDAPVDDDTVVVTDAEVADLERQLDEIDQLLAGIDADLSQD